MRRWWLFILSLLMLFSNTVHARARRLGERSLLPSLLAHLLFLFAPLTDTTHPVPSLHAHYLSVATTSTLARTQYDLRDTPQRPSEMPDHSRVVVGTTPACLSPIEAAAWASVASAIVAIVGRRTFLLIRLSSNSAHCRASASFFHETSSHTRELVVILTPSFFSAPFSQPKVRTALTSCGLILMSPLCTRVTAFLPS